MDGQISTLGSTSVTKSKSHAWRSMRQRLAEAVLDTQGHVQVPALLSWTSRIVRYGYLLCCGIVLLCNGCYKLSYHEAVPKVEATGDGTIVVVTHDQRPYVVSGQTKPEVVGVKRGGYGNPFQVSTASGRPLAEDMTTIICNGLQRKGFQCIPMQAMASDSPDTIRRRLQEATRDIALLLILREWRSDTFFTTTLFHDTTLEVLGRNNTILATTSSQGSDVLPGVSVAVDPSHTAVPLALKSILEELLNHPNVVAALQSARGR